MKKSLFLALIAASALLSGCTNSVPDAGDNGSNTPISSYSTEGTNEPTKGSSGAGSPLVVKGDPRKPDDPYLKKPKEGEEVGVISTDFGKMVIKFREDVAPETVKNFKKLASSGFYNGTMFHRIMEKFMIQGGDPLTKDKKNKAEFGTGGPGYTIKDEFSDLTHERGVISMAHSAAPNSGGSQFFITVADSNHLDTQYSLFGYVCQGMEVADKIVSQPKGGPSGDLAMVDIPMKVSLEKWPLK